MSDTKGEVFHTRRNTLIIVPIIEIDVATDWHVGLQEVVADIGRIGQSRYDKMAA